MIPLILGAAALGTAAFGALAGAAGIADMNEAKEIGEIAQEQYELAISQFQADWEATNQLAEEYGELQLNVKVHTIGRFVAFLERIGQRAAQGDMRFLAGLKISTQQFKEYKAEAIKAEQFFKGGATAAIAGAAASQSAIGLVGLFGTASTGAAISGLGGAAAWNATLAWLGGGSLAAGGGGMALGTLVLGGIAVGPALAVGGFMLAGKGEEALTKALEYEAQVNTEVAKIEATGEFLQVVEQQIAELGGIVEELNARILVSLEDLETWFDSQQRNISLLQKVFKVTVKTMPTFFGWIERKSQTFESDEQIEKFQQVALLVKTLAEIVKTPILDSQGNLNPAAVTIQAKYRTLVGN